MLKPKKINFYYFSGTGNTALVVKEMSDFFIKQGYDVQIEKIEKSNPELVSFNHTLGFAFPVAMQSTYAFIWDFFENLPQTTEQTEVFMVDTLAAFSGGIVGPLKRLLSKKGYKPIGAKEIIMPSNYRYSKKESEKKDEKIAKGLKEAKKFAFGLIFNTVNWRSGLYPNPLEKISRLEKPMNFMRKIADFSVDESICVKCGLCASLCPIENIVLKDSKGRSDFLAKV